MNVHEQWQETAIEIGHRVRSMVNTPEMIDTDDETGYVLMFFSARNHNGKSTLVSSTTDVATLRKLLKTALQGLNKATIVEPSHKEH
jgi:hypothetical protein